MANVLLWNVQQKALDELVLRLVQTNQLDLLVLVEHDGGRSALSELLSGARFRQAASHARFGVFVREPFILERLRTPLPGNRADFWRVGGPSSGEGLLVAVHGPDRRNSTDAGRKLVFRRVAEEVLRLEAHVGHRRTVVVGDFNANPFDPAVTDSDGLHALGVRAVSGRTYRTVASEPRSFFYNPMWRL